MVSIRAKVKSRLEKFLEVDSNGYRRAILCIFIKVKKTTIDELHEMLSSRYNVSRNTVASMVGYIHSKLGILRAHKESYKTPMVYLLREEYIDLIMKIVASPSKSSTDSAAWNFINSIQLPIDNVACEKRPQNSNHYCGTVGFEYPYRSFKRPIL